MNNIVDIEAYANWLAERFDGPEFDLTGNLIPAPSEVIREAIKEWGGDFEPPF